MSYHLLSEEYISPKTGCGCTYFRGPDNVCLLHNHEFYEFVLTLSKNVIHEVNNMRTKPAEYTLMLIRPNDMHRFVDEGQGEFSYLNLAFTSETFDDIANYLKAEDNMRNIVCAKMPPYVELSKKQGMSMKNQFMSLMGEPSIPEPKSYSRALIASLFSKYFLNIIDSENTEHTPQWFTALCAEINKIENLSLNAEELTNISGRCYSHICYSFKKYLNTSPTKYINDIRLKYARNMVLHTNMTILEIAYECGFENMGYFHKLFKTKFGTSPGELRKKSVINPVM